MTKLTLILGMMVVTYLPRLLPFMMFKNKNVNKDFERFLKLIPYTALGALIIPGVFTAVEGELFGGIIGAIVAVIVALLTENLVLTVILSILATFFIIII